MNHSFDVEIAQQYGVDAAILIEHFRFWIAKNKANNRHFYDGRYWTYNSAKAFAELFPYWSPSQIVRIIKKLEDAGVLIAGNFNTSPYDRTKWYSLNREFDLTKSSNENGGIVKTLTDINTDEYKPSCQQPTATDACPHQKIIALYAEQLPELTQVRTWDGARVTNMKARWRWVLADLKSKGKPHDEEAGLDFFKRMFAYVRQSDFLMGRSGRWMCDLPWLMKAENFVKVIEGNYENRDGE